MKKIAFFVEGQTEQFFINRLLREVANEKTIATDLRILRGGKKTIRQESLLPANEYPLSTYSNPQNPKYEALIYDCGGDNYDALGKLKSEIISDIIEMQAGLARQGYTEIIGLRDLYPLTDLAKLERGLDLMLSRANLIPSSVTIAVREIEDWFLAECNHYTCIDASLVLDATQLANLGFNPCIEDLTLRNTTAAEDLRSVYQLVGKTYNKTKDKVERTVECLDYAKLYIEVSCRVHKLNDLIDKINNFLT